MPPAKELGITSPEKEPMYCEVCGYEIATGLEMTEHKGKYYHKDCFQYNFRLCVCGELKKIDGGETRRDGKWTCLDCITIGKEKLFQDKKLNRTDDKEFRKTLKQFLDCHFTEKSKNPTMFLNVTDIEVAELDDRFIVRVTSHRPGILIGLHGSDADAMENWMNVHMFHVLKEIKIEFKESQLFRNLYGY